MTNDRQEDSLLRASRPTLKTPNVIGRSLVGWGLLTFTFWFSGSLAAAVEWTATAASARASAGQGVVALEFPYRNTGPQSVRVARIQPTCDCLSASAEPDEVASGEWGRIAVKFTLGGRSGRQEKSVNVFFADQPGTPVELRLVVDIPEPVAIAPRFVFWRVGQAAEPQAFEIALADRADKLSEVSCADAGFAVRLEPTPHPGHWRVVVQPADTSQLRQAVVRLSAIVAGQPRVFVLHAAVK